MKRIMLLITIIALVSCATPALAGGTQRDAISAGEWLRDLSQDHKLDIVADDMEIGFLTMDKSLSAKLSRMSPDEKLFAMSILLQLSVDCVNEKAKFFRSTSSIASAVTVCVDNALH